MSDLYSENSARKRRARIKHSRLVGAEVVDLSI